MCVILHSKCIITHIIINCVIKRKTEKILGAIATIIWFIPFLFVLLSFDI